MSAAVTLLLVPGLLSDQTVWQPFIDRVDGRFPVQVADLTSQNSLTQMAVDTLEACPGQLYVAGHSMGARVAMEMIRLCPERILKLALLDTGTHPFKPGEEVRRIQLVKLAHTEGMRALADQWLIPMVHPHHADDQLLMQKLLSMVETMTAEIHENQIHALLHRPDAVPGLRDIKCPTLVLVGRQDVWSPVNQHQALCQHLVSGELVVIENAGHFAPL